MINLFSNKGSRWSDTHPLDKRGEEGNVDDVASLDMCIEMLYHLDYLAMYDAKH